MSIDALQRFLVEKRRRKEIEVTAKVAQFNQLNKVDAERELLGITTTLDSQRREQNKLDNRIMRKEESLNDINISLEALAGGYSGFKSLSDIDRTTDGEKEYGTTLSELSRRIGDENREAHRRLNSLNETIKDGAIQKVQVERTLDWLSKPPVVNRVAPDTIGPEDWGQKAYSAQFPDDDKGLTSHLFGMYPLTTEKEEILKVKEKERKEGIKAEADARIAEAESKVDREYTLGQRELQKENEEYVKGQRDTDEQKNQREADREGLGLSLSATRGSKINQTFTALSNAVGEESLSDGEFTYTHKEGEIIKVGKKTSILQDKQSVKYDSRNTFIRERMIESRLSPQESLDIFGEKHVAGNLNTQIRTLSLVTDLEQLADDFKALGMNYDMGAYLEEGYENITSYLTGFNTTNPNYASMHDIASLIKKNRDYLRKDSEHKARAYMASIKDNFGISFGEDDALIDYYINPIFENTEPLKYGDRIKRGVDYLEKASSWSPDHFRKVFSKFTKDKNIFSKGSDDSEVQMLLDMARDSYKKENNLKKITNAKELKDYSMQYIIDLRKYFLGDR